LLEARFESRLLGGSSACNAAVSGGCPDDVPPSAIGAGGTPARQPARALALRKKSRLKAGLKTKKPAKKRAFKTKIYQDLLGAGIYVPGQARFMARGGIFMQHAFIDRLVDQRDRRKQKLLAFLVISGGNSGTKLFDGGTQLAAVAAVDIAFLFVLPVSFFG
jgi:hypothetical protein